MNDDVITVYSQSTRNDSRRADDIIVIADTYVIGHSDQMSQKKKKTIQGIKRKRKEDEKRGMRRINDRNTGSTRATDQSEGLTNLNESILQKRKTICLYYIFIIITKVQWNLCFTATLLGDHPVRRPSPFYGQKIP